MDRQHSANFLTAFDYRLRSKKMDAADPCSSAANVGAGLKDAETSPAKGFCPRDGTTSPTGVSKLPRTRLRFGAGAPCAREEEIAGEGVRFTPRGEP